MTITLWEGLNQSKSYRVHLEIDLTSSRFSQSASQVSDDMTSTEAREEGGSVQDSSEKTMTPWTFDIKFPHGTEFTFRSLMFVAGEHRDLKMLPPRQAPEHLAQVWILMHGSTSAPPSLFEASWSCCPSSGHSSEHQVHLHQYRPPIKIHLTTIPRLGPVHMGVTPRVSKPHDYANHMFMRL
jgi:hypothetical protein